MFLISELCSGSYTSNSSTVGESDWLACVFTSMSPLNVQMKILEKSGLVVFKAHNVVEQLPGQQQKLMCYCCSGLAIIAQVYSMRTSHSNE